MGSQRVGHDWAHTRNSAGALPLPPLPMNLRLFWGAELDPINIPQRLNYLQSLPLFPTFKKNNNKDVQIGDHSIFHVILSSSSWLDRSLRGQTHTPGKGPPTRQTPKGHLESISYILSWVATLLPQTDVQNQEFKTKQRKCRSPQAWNSFGLRNTLASFTPSLHSGGPGRTMTIQRVMTLHPGLWAQIFKGILQCWPVSRRR